MLFDNPIYETDGKKLPDGGGDSSKDVVSHEMETIAILRCANDLCYHNITLPKFEAHKIFVVLIWQYIL